MRAAAVPRSACDAVGLTTRAVREHLLPSPETGVPLRAAICPLALPRIPFFVVTAAPFCLLVALPVPPDGVLRL